ncbi:hypothetical protein SAMN05444354_112156 [Stigmatella aurantiaca]|uniref:Uncharacterized protein n=1 Tax=Stigmatella aurantiaca TaxID=41 RepID=A0A1H7W557_STIAU|nr:MULTISPECIES: hypothetical protein [Stigmatella]SEM16611.1 hypothetical protein SAMN05444354_112156 [Stigmatella aurantiaca]
MSDETKERVRYGRAQKFQLSPRGSEAVAAYELMLAEARSGSGRAQFDAARASWGAPRGLASEDGLFLVEFGAGDRTIAEAMSNLEDCGTTAKELKAAVDRLLSCGMLQPVAAPPPPPAPAPRRYW